MILILFFIYIFVSGLLASKILFFLEKAVVHSAPSRKRKTREKRVSRKIYTLVKLRIYFGDHVTVYSITRLKQE
jgi:hypothetical protein